jgi:hypothetical protein
MRRMVGVRLNALHGRSSLAGSESDVRAVAETRFAHEVDESIRT